MTDTDNLTSKQRLVLEYMRGFFADNDQLPPNSAIADHFRFDSPNAAQEHRAALERKGYIEKNTVGKYRFARAKQ